MRIRKKYQVIPTNAKLENGHSTSDKNGYTCEYLNGVIPQITRKTYTTTATANSAVTPYNAHAKVAITSDIQTYGTVIGVYAVDEWGVAVPSAYVLFNGTTPTLVASCNLSAPNITFYVTYMK